MLELIYLSTYIIKRFYLDSKTTYLRITLEDFSKGINIRHLMAELIMMKLTSLTSEPPVKVHASPVSHSPLAKPIFSLARAFLVEADFSQRVHFRVDSLALK